MKGIYLMFVFFLFASKFSYAQDCVIRMREAESDSFSEVANKGIKFIIKLQDTSLISSDKGDLTIAKSVYSKIADEDVVAVTFYNGLDMQFYREPMFSRTKRKLSEYCGRLLAAAKRR